MLASGTSRRRPLTTRRVLGVTVAGVAVLAAACGSSSKTSSTPTTTIAPAGSATTVAKGSGPVDVLSAGSLEDLMQKVITPAFHAATAYTLDNFSAGSSDLASDIKGKVRVGDVFISASPAVNTTLMGPSNGNWVNWYATFAASPLVLGYYPKSKFATDLKTMPWYDVITMPGILVGLTDPANDPKGALTVQALDQAAAAHNLPALKSIGTDSKNIFQETSLAGEVGSGQLDVGFFYVAEANAAGIPYVPLTGINLAGDYTITILNQAPHAAAANAFVQYLLGPDGQAAMRAEHFEIISPPKVTGSGVPSELSGVLPGS